VIVHTLDCFSNQIRDEKDTVENVDFTRINPATGPIYVEGARPGDTLKVNVEKIELAERGVIATIKNAGVLGSFVKTSKTRLCEIKDNFVYYLGHKIPIRKMIGVIGVASKEEFPTGVPDRHGGNMDSRIITEGSTLYLPVFQEGALFGLGDLHAAMGDGEVCVTACETYGKVTIRIDLIKSSVISWPTVEYEGYIYIIVSSENLENALTEATREGVKYIQKSLDLSWEEAYMMASMIMDLEISQLVDPKKTVRAKIPKRYVDLEAVL